MTNLEDSFFPYYLPGYFDIVTVYTHDINKRSNKWLK